MHGTLAVGMCWRLASCSATRADATGMFPFDWMWVSRPASCGPDTHINSAAAAACMGSGLPALLDNPPRQLPLPLTVSGICQSGASHLGAPPIPIPNACQLSQPSALLQATMLSSSLYREAGLAGLLRNSLTTPTGSPATSGFLASPR